MLPGKLCIGLLEEDNPLKSYFRLKPLLVESNGLYEEFDCAEEYPENGCLRIVPDKNESSHFKTRMRRMGCFAVLDLREHALENDKIRPNKNYHNDETERNAHIVYSDVVREPAEASIFAVTDAKEGDAWPGPELQSIVLADTRQICVEQDGVIVPTGALLPEEGYKEFSFTLEDEKQLRIAVRDPQAAAPVAEKPAEKPAEPPQVKPAVEDKPWLCRDLSREAPSQNSVTGLNPRRSRSLQEIIEEKWRYSRVDQLGHPVPANAMGHPVQDPVEKAVGAIGDVWKNPELHARLIAEIAGMESFSSALEDRRKAAVNSAIQRELDDLEAERLKALNELDRLQREKRTLRETFKREIREEEEEAFREYSENTKRAREEYAESRKQADDARATVEKLNDVYASLTDGRFEGALMDFAVTSRAARFITDAPAAKAAPAASLEAVSAGEWIERLQRCFAAEGLALDRVHAANLLVCAALCNVLFLSGGASADKSAAARALSHALGRGEGCAVLRSFNRCADMPADFAEDKLWLCEAADSFYPICAETLQQGAMIRLDPPAADSPWQLCRGDKPVCPPTDPSVLRNAFLRDTALPAAVELRMQSLRDALASHGVYLSAAVLERSRAYCAAMTAAQIMPPETALDWAFAQFALPCVLAEAPVDCLTGLREMLIGMAKCTALLDSKAPVRIG